MSICTRRNGCICQGSVVSALVVSGWCYLFAVRFSSLFLNKFVINVVSLPRYVKEAHFYLVVSVCPSEVVVGCLWVGVLCVWTGKPLFNIMSRMVSTFPLTHFCAGGMCLVYCIGILWLHICVGLDSWRSTG
jgi:hypothetical protein